MGERDVAGRADERARLRPSQERGDELALVADGVEAVERARWQVALLQQARDGPVRPEGELRAAGAGRRVRQ